MTTGTPLTNIETTLSKRREIEAGKGFQYSFQNIFVLGHNLKIVVKWCSKYKSNRYYSDLFDANKKYWVDSIYLEKYDVNKYKNEFVVSYFWKIYGSKKISFKPKTVQGDYFVRTFIYLIFFFIFFYFLIYFLIFMRANSRAADCAKITTYNPVNPLMVG